MIAAIKQYISRAILYLGAVIASLLIMLSMRKKLDTAEQINKEQAKTIKAMQGHNTRINEAIQANEKSKQDSEAKISDRSNFSDSSF